jgi:hypothetical protein
MIVSLTYVLLNLPHFYAWAYFFKAFPTLALNIIDRHYYFSLNNITEIFYVLSYAVHPFIYGISNQKFKNQFKKKIFHMKTNQRGHANHYRVKKNENLNNQQTEIL